MHQTRRDFLRRAGLVAGSAAMASTLENLAVTSALAQGPGYKALVCVFMGGGNDANNMVIPTGSNPEAYPAYQTARGTAGLAHSLAALAPTAITPLNLGGATFALHPNMATGFQTNPSMLQLWNQNRLAVVANVGPLVRPLVDPTPRQAYQQNPALRPNQLFSHSNQVQIHQTSMADRVSNTGWGGRIADRFPPHASGFPMVASIAGTPVFSLGLTTRPLAMSPAPAALNSVLTLTGYTPQFPTIEPEMSRRNAFDFMRTTGRGNVIVRGAGDVMSQSVQIAQALSVNPTLTTTFPNTNLGNQLLQVARIIRANQQVPQLQLTRQVFFTSVGGFDTHQNQLGGQGGLMTQVNQAIGSFYQATVEMGVVNQVTTFTLSDFNRTFDPAGSGGSVGSDHAWGSHQFVIGGAVDGQKFYGVNGPSGTPFPVLLMGRYVGNAAVQDTDTRGRWVPSTSVEQYAATLAAWFGVSVNDLRTLVFPYLTRFTPENLGFMV